MKTNNNNRNERNSRYTRKAVENLKAMIKANDIETLTLEVYGIQIYASYVTGEEYTVIMKAERDIMTGRYYFITREGDRIAWSRLDIDTLIHAAVDFMDRVEELEKQAAEYIVNTDESENSEAEAEPEAPAVERVDDCTTRYNNVTAARIIESVLNIAEAVGLTYGSSYPAQDAKIDIIRFAKWMDGESSDVINPALPFFFAIRKQGSESGTREHCKSRCAVLGSPVYIIKVERKPADLFALSIRAAGHKAAAEVFAAATAAEDTKRAAESHQESENDNEPTNTPAAASETATANENEPRTENKSKAAELAAVVADYAAGTWAHTIKPAALYLFRFVWFAAIAAATFGTMGAVATLLADMPHTLTAWIRIPFGLVAVFGSPLAVEVALLAISKRIDRATNSRLLAMH